MENINKVQQTELNEDHSNEGDPSNREFFMKSRKDTQNTIANSLNFKTPTKKVQDKFRKVNRSCKPRIIPPLERERKTIISPEEIADNYENILKNPHKKSKPGKNRKRKKEEDLQYNKPFTDRELITAIKQQNNTASGEDIIHPQMIKKTTTRDTKVPA